MKNLTIALLPLLMLLFACNNEVQVVEKYENGNNKSVRTFKDGKLVGIGYNYDQDGHVTQEIYYNKGKEDSTLLYEHGVKVHKVEIKYNELGRLAERNDYAWYENGAMKFQEGTAYDDARLKTYSVITNWKKNGIKYSETQTYYSKGVRDSSIAQNWFHGKREIVHQYFRDNSLTKIKKQIYKGQKLINSKEYLIEDDSLEMEEVDMDEEAEASESDQ